MDQQRTELDEVYFNIEWSSGKPFQVVGLGQNAVDWLCVLPHYPEHNTKTQIEQLYQLGGGQIATAVAMCARYGLKTRYIGRVGDDDIGSFSLEDLKREPMDLCVDVVKGAFSQFAFILVDRPTGERTILWDRDPKLRFGEGELEEEKVTAGQLLHLDGYDIASSLQAARWARQAGMKVSLDVDKPRPGVDELLQLVDFALPNISFVMEFSGRKSWKEGLLVVSEACPGLVGVTLGKQGAAVVWKRKIHEIPGITVNAVDTTGAGDVFHGGFIYGLFQNWSLERCLRFANAAGALACTRYGARAGIPALEDALKMT